MIKFDYDKVFAVDLTAFDFDIFDLKVLKVFVGDYS